jgi:hypothetical protein
VENRDPRGCVDVDDAASLKDLWLTVFGVKRLVMLEETAHLAW